ncbi:ABC transporter permease subunit [Halapricum sp. CBA1109]|uniref:sugar ABC transporter permease n=1 Tax=Halapricum sp. CBA1109 TaxID=2668068 RepID=UPI0012FA0ACE|nr:ABC transporter permease subunit [Halapricum sp. CBA1109]MUV88773.1 ABC transporter permease subunit [Halapricum sp. CBA1109]
MSIASGIVKSVYQDIRNGVTAPVRLAKEIRYTINGLQEGKIPPKWVAWTLISTAGAAALVIALMFPIYWIATMAFNPNASLFSTDGAGIIPTVIAIENFAWAIGNITVPQTIVVNAPLIGELFQFPVPAIGGEMVFNGKAIAGGEQSDFLGYFQNSLYVSFWTVTVAMSVVIPGAYAMSRRSFVGRKKMLYLYILLTQIGGGLGIAVLIALYAIFSGMGWYNNKLALSFYYAATTVPFNTWLLKTYMDGIPTSYEEAAIVDGAPSWRIVYEIIIPLSKAGLATVFIFIFLAGWMDYIVAATLLEAENFTLPVGLFALIDEFGVPWGRFSAFALMFGMPIMLVYFFAQRYIEQGLSFGGMSG